jgi:hypothetical protein
MFQDNLLPPSSGHKAKQSLEKWHGYSEEGLGGSARTNKNNRKCEEY